MAELLLESMETEWDPKKYHDTHRQKVEAIVEEKRQGHDVIEGTVRAPSVKVVDLMEALSASIKNTSSGKGTITATTATTAKSTKGTKSTKAPAAKRAAPAKRATPIKKTPKDTDVVAKARAPRRKAS